MWRRITGVILLVFGIVMLGAELFSIIALNYYLLLNTAFIVFRIAIAIVLISLGIKLKKAYNQNTDESDDWDDWE